MTKFRLEVDDPIAKAVLGVSTRKCVWTGDRLLKKLRTLRIRDADTLARDELNRKLGPTGKALLGYESAAHGSYRHHWQIEGKLRCAYFILSQKDRVGVVVSDPGWNGVLPELKSDSAPSVGAESDVVESSPRNQRRNRSVLGKTGVTLGGKRLQTRRGVNVEPPDIASLMIDQNQERAVTRVGEQS
mmetsp:Transcript_22386/g.70124  ORF Transcript_22386/g.70124 Transcript_22386/m.70124 type:complete len:187 (-) Transcript_22386:1052-1612(-)